MELMVLEVDEGGVTDSDAVKISLRTEHEASRSRAKTATDNLEDAKRQSSIQLEDLQRKHGLELEDAKRYSQEEIRRLIREHGVEKNELKKRLETALKNKTPRHQNELQAANAEGQLFQQKAQVELDRQREITRAAEENVQGLREELKRVRSVSSDLRTKIVGSSSTSASLERKNGHRFPTRSILKARTVISPPESSQNSSDDELSTNRGRVRELANLAELQEAIRIIEQHRVRSLDRTKEETRKARKILELDDPSNQQNQQNIQSPPLQESPLLPLSVGARKISHSRSSTEPNVAYFDIPSRDQSNASGRRTSYSGVIEDQLQILRHSSDSEDEEEDLPVRPAMIRKKSGELVRPALRPASGKRRPSSMPGTPTYSKAVHVDQRLEHVRHFLQVDRPLPVSAGSSPVETMFYDDSEFPFGSDENESRTRSFSWEIRLTNFPADTPERKSLPVRVERVYLSTIRSLRAHLESLESDNKSQSKAFVDLETRLQNALKV